MSFIQNFFTSRDNNANAATYVGQQDRLWYNPITQTMYVSDGVTPGGIPVNLATGANITANVLTVNTITSTSGNVGVTSNLVISGNISPAGANKIGGIFPGPGVVIGTNGQLTIDSANLPVSFGNFYANNNVLSIVNVDEDMILKTDGNAEIQLVGNIGFYKPDGIPPNVANRFAFFNSDGQASFFIPATDPLAGAFKIIGSNTGNVYPPLNNGVMLQITGQTGDASRLYNDSVGSFSAFVGRRLNGTIASPTAVQAGDEIIRISSTGYNGNTIPGTAGARIVFQAMENFTPTTNGSNLSFWSTAVGSNTLTKIATVDVANGFNATKFTTAGTVSATGNITGGNINTVNVSLTGNVIGNVITGGVISASGNVTGGNILTGGLISATGNIYGGNVLFDSGIISGTGNVISGNTIVEGVIRYDQATNNATANGFNKTGGTVTANGRTGQLTSLADLLAKGAAGTFTVNNNYITSAKDVVIINIASGGSTNSYAVAVTAVNSAGSFQVTVTNNGSGGLSEALVFNFAVIKVS